MDLGCDTQGYSRAGNDTMIWYCVILAGRLGPELNEMREVSFHLNVFWIELMEFGLNISIICCFAYLLLNTMHLFSPLCISI